MSSNSTSNATVSSSSLAGTLVVSEAAVTFTYRGGRIVSIPRSAITGVECLQIARPTFGRGGAWRITFKSAAETIVAPRVGYAEGQMVKQIFGLA